MGRKRNNMLNNNNEFDLPTIKSRKMLNSLDVAKEKKLIIVLEGAQLESVKVGSSYELLNCDDHANILRKMNRDPGTVRPDITHQSLLMLLDSPLNRAGLLQVYVKTERNVLIWINPQTRIPRTFKRFGGLMVQLLHKFSIRANEESVKLLEVIKNPVNKWLPDGSKKYTMSFTGELIKSCRDIVPEAEPVVCVIGAFAHGQLNVDYTERSISISNYPLSAATACTKLCNAFEEVWEVI